MQSNLQDYLAVESAAETCHPGSFEGCLRQIFDRGEFFCNRCMEILANYVDLDKLVTPEVERDQLYPTKQTKRLSVQLLRTVDILPSKPRQRDRSLKTLQPEVEPVKSVALPDLSTLVPKLATGIFQDDRFTKLCELLEQNIAATVQATVKKEDVKLSIIRRSRLLR